ncbi:MAG: hypothetical protein JRH12_13830 [Deltaproteobacteria bacterium]|jgi:hypothetical protein|nr:hypothetical protein [Deltaproteobacteria bacterium]MBW2483011.1 hypothetical protein [Deltaproteobacteria bacterium]
MQNKYKQVLFIAVIVAISVTLGFSSIQAQDKRDMQGWEIDSPYNQLYDVREYEKIRAWVVRLKEVVPMPGMAPATAMDVREGPEVFEVHICPTWYRKPGEIRLKKGDRIKMRGVWAEINGKEVFMASKIKQDPDTTIIKVRLTKDGTPFWTMPPEQLAMELKSD